VFPHFYVQINLLSLGSVLYAYACDGQRSTRVRGGCFRKWRRHTCGFRRSVAVHSPMCEFHRLDTFSSYNPFGKCLIKWNWRKEKDVNFMWCGLSCFQLMIQRTFLICLNYYSNLYSKKFHRILVLGSSLMIIYTTFFLLNYPFQLIRKAINIATKSIVH